MRIFTRYVARFSDGRGPAWGTCAKWAADFGPGVEVTAQSVAVVGTRLVVCHYCGGEHPALPIPAEVTR